MHIVKADQLDHLDHSDHPHHLDNLDHPDHLDHLYNLTNRKICCLKKINTELALFTLSCLISNLLKTNKGING